MRANYLIAVAFILFVAARVPARIIDESTPPTPVAGELSLIDPANGQAKSLLKVEGQSLGRPLIVGDTLYVTSSESAVYALDPQTGESKWKYIPVGTVFGMSASSKALFVGTASKLVALDPASGKILWQYDGDIPILDPATVGSLVIVNTLDGPVALDQETGKVRWRLGMQWSYFVFSPLSDSRMCVWKPDEIFVVETDHGRTLWQSAADQNVSAPGALPTPAVAVGGIICQLRGTPHDADDWWLYAREASNGRQIWKTPLGQQEATSPKTTLLGKSVYCVLNNNLFALDQAEGKLQWKATIKPLEAGGAGLVAAKGVLYVPALGGDVSALDEKTGKEIWISPAPKPSDKAQIRIGGTFAADAGLFITRNEQTK